MARHICDKHPDERAATSDIGDRSKWRTTKQSIMPSDPVLHISELEMLAMCGSKLWNHVPIGSASAQDGVVVIPSSTPATINPTDAKLLLLKHRWRCKGTKGIGRKRLHMHVCDLQRADAHPTAARCRAPQDNTGAACVCCGRWHLPWRS